MNAESYRLVKRSVNGLTSEKPVDGMFIKAASLGPGHDDIEVDAVNSKLLSSLDPSHAFTIECRAVRAGVLEPVDEEDVVEFLPASAEAINITPETDRYLAIAYAEVSDSGEAARMVDQIADYRAAKMSTAAMAGMLTTMLQRLVDFNQKYGLVHNDLHQGNVLYDKMAGKFVVIDYGRSVFRKKEALIREDFNIGNEVRAMTALNAARIDVGSNEYCDPWHWDGAKKHDKYYWVSDYATICMQIFYGCYLKSTGTAPSAEARQKFQPLDHIDAVRKYLGRALTKIVEPAAHLYHAVVCTGMGTINPCFNSNFTMTKTGTTVFMDHLNNYIKKTGFTAAIFHRNSRDVALLYDVIGGFVEGIKASGLKTPFGVTRVGGGILPDDMAPEKEIDCPFPTSLQEAYGAEFRALTEPLGMESWSRDMQDAAESIGEVDFEETISLPAAMPADKAGFFMPNSYENSVALGEHSGKIGAWSPDDEDEADPYEEEDLPYDEYINKRSLPVEDDFARVALRGGASGASLIANLALAAVVGACSILGSMR
jgi:RIO1 family